MPSAVSSNSERSSPPRTPMVAWLTPSGNGWGVRTERSSLIASSSLLPWQSDSAPTGFAPVTVGVEVAFETVEHVVGGADAQTGRHLGGADRAVARPTQEGHRSPRTGSPAGIRRRNPVPQFVGEAVVAPTV